MNPPTLARCSSCNRDLPVDEFYWRKDTDSRRLNCKSCCRETQADGRHPLYGTWNQIRHRCRNPKNTAYPDYGGRGITVCDRWYDSFEAFAEDVGPRPPGLQIDREDNERGYEPGNVRWVTAQQNALNRRSNLLITAFGRTQHLSKWAIETGLDADTISLRLKKGVPPEEAVSDPLYKPTGEFTAFGRTQTRAAWSREFGVDKNTLKQRLDRGMSPEEALTTPRRRGGYWRKP